MRSFIIVRTKTSGFTFKLLILLLNKNNNLRVFLNFYNIVERIVFILNVAYYIVDK